MYIIPPVHPIEAEAWKSTFRTPSVRVVQEQLSQTRSACRRGLSALDNQEQILMLRLKEISQAKARLNARLKRLEAAIAPHRHLPPELLSRIFELTRDDELHMPPMDPRMMKFKPFRIQERRRCRPEHVCSLWRQVAQQTPLLVKNVWQVAKVNFFELYKLRDAQFPSSILELASLSREIIARGTHTLDINFGRWMLGLDEGVAALWVPDDELLGLAVETGSPHMEKIILRNYDLSQPFLDRCAELFSSFPRLKSITLEYDIENDWVRFFPLHRYPLHNLTELTIIFPAYLEPGRPIVSTDGFYQILRSSPKLKTCHVHVSCTIGNPTAFEPARDNFVHHSLENLEISRDYCNCTGFPDSCEKLLAPFQHLTLPALVDIQVLTWETLKQCQLRVLFELITRSQCKLEKWGLDANWGQSDTPLPGSEWAALTPHLVNVTSIMIPSLILPAGAPREIAEGRHLPSLSGLECQILESDQHYQPILLELLGSRPSGEKGWRHNYIGVIPESGSPRNDLSDHSASDVVHA